MQTPIPFPHKPNPAMTHFVSLLSHIEHSEQSLVALRNETQSESDLLSTYFASAALQIAALKPLTAPITAPNPTPEQLAAHQAAVETRRQKWTEMEAMEKWKGKVDRLAENVRRREEVEMKLRGLLREVGEAMLEREMLAIEGGRVDALL
jgi:hypothetical protein